MRGQDFRYALRGMRRSWGFTAIAVLSVGIGIGANTAIFSVVKGVLLAPLPYSEPQRLFAIRETIQGAKNESLPVSPMHLLAWREQCPSLAGVALSRLTAFSMTSAEGAEEIAGVRVDPVFFDVLGVRPAIGRSFAADEAQDGEDRVVVLSDALWRRRFAASPTVAGRSINMGGLEFTVIGVLPPDFRMPFSGNVEPYSQLTREPQIYQPLAIDRAELRPMGNFNYGGVARLKNGATAARALAEMNAVQSRFPTLVKEKVALGASLLPLEDLFSGNVRRGLWILFAAVGAVLLIVCVNLANLLIARITARSREAAIRAALGASSSRQLGQIFAESLTVCLMGGVLGVVLAMFGVDALVAEAPADLPRLDQVRLDGVVLAFAVAISLATGLVSGLLPALAMLRSDPQDALKSGSHTITGGIASLRTRQILIAVEVAVSAALLILAGLFTSSFVRVMSIDKGFEAQKVLTADLSLLSTKYTKPEERDGFFRRLLARLASAPGVKFAALVTTLPSRGEKWIDPVWLEGDTRPMFERPMPNNRPVSPDYFKALGIPILNGHSFEERDRGQNVAVISEKLAQRLWPGDTALGRRFVGADRKLYEVTGVVGDVRTTLTKDAPMVVYYPYWSRLPYLVSIVVRTSGDPLAAASAVRAAVRAEDSQVPIREMQTLEQVVGASVEQRRFQMLVVLLFACSALLVACLGIYGIVAFSVSRRRTEIGVRAVLGARPGGLVLLIVRQGMMPVILGIAGGVAIALSLGRIVRGLLFDVKPSDPLTIAVVSVLLFVVALFACVIPARAAVINDPAKSLRFE